MARPKKQLTEEQKDFNRSLKEAEKEARLREIEGEKKVVNLKVYAVDAMQEASKTVQEKLDEVKELTGEEYAVHKVRKENSKVGFTQMIDLNVLFLAKHKYLTLAEKGFLHEIGPLLHFGTNVICEEQPAKKKMTPGSLPKPATISYLADLFEVDRKHLGNIIGSLEQKGIMTSLGAKYTIEGRICTARTLMVNPNYMFKGDKSKINDVTKMVFRESLKYIEKIVTDKKGKDVKKKLDLPIRLWRNDFTPDMEAISFVDDIYNENEN